MGQAQQSLVGSIASSLSPGLAALGHISQGYATSSADQLKAEQAQMAAEIGRQQALSTDTTMRQRMNITLGNIEAIRAAGHADQTSPTTAALLDRERAAGDATRMAAVGSQRMQAAEDEATAAYLRKAGDFAVTMGYVGAGEDLLSALAKPLTTGGGDIGGSLFDALRGQSGPLIGLP
jgi:hypothetical protein